MTYTAAELRRGQEVAELYEAGQRGALRALSAAVKERIRELEPLPGSAPVVTELKSLIKWLETQ